MTGNCFIFGNIDSIFMYTRCSQAFAKLMREKIEERYPDCGSDDLFLAVAHLLDPWSRGVLLEMKFGNIEDVKTLMIQKWTNLVNNNPPPPPETENEEALNVADDPLEELMNRRDQVESRNDGSDSPESQSLRDEISRFFGKPKVSSETDKLAWWAKQDDLPTLKKICREVYAIPVSSSKSERVFSQAGKVNLI